jgi:hypothetical protein
VSGARPVVDLEHFAKRGFLRVPSALAPDLVTRWRENALPRLREHEASQLVDSVPPSPPDAFAALDPQRPRTWRWRRATLRRTESVRIADAAPALAEALDALLGGPALLRDESVTDYLILSFPARGLRRWLPARPATSRVEVSYHLDDPRPGMTLRGWRNAVLLVLLFSDLAPGGGGPVLACDSPPRVARALATGGDFTDPALAAGIARECTDRLEVTGRAGDAFVLHPFVLHTPTRNRSGRLRVLANPMLRARRELDFSPGAAGDSPLERITRGWVDERT